VATMSTIYDVATVVRSKNAGPFTLTIDLMFDDDAALQRVLASPAFTPRHIAELYGADPAQVQIHRFERVRAVKVTLPRACSSGSAQDSDVYGCQQHFPLAQLEV